MIIFWYLLLIILAVLADYYWLDMDSKRWGWFKKGSKKQKAIFFTLVLLVTFIGYILIDIEYFKI
ncbi:hypothetical protein SAMN04488574_13215 [Bacillus sp. 71mf]|nr:hypothetical protein SAMN04488574_13215 [Bacillus sp. 71mf]SFS56437.1 hypothetical protein SAMN04488145_1011316 [Bacillus sp. 103mf]